MSFIVFWSGLYYIDLLKKADTYLTNPFQCIINIGFPIGFALAVLIVLLLPFILKEKPWIKKEGVTLEDFEFMKKFKTLYIKNKEISDNEKENNVYYINGDGADDGIFTRRL